MVMSGFLKMSGIKDTLHDYQPAAIFEKPFELSKMRKTIEDVLTSIEVPPK